MSPFSPLPALMLTLRTASGITGEPASPRKRDHGRIPRTGAGGGEGVAGLGLLLPPLELIVTADEDGGKDEEEEEPSVEEERGAAGAVGWNAGEFGTTRAGDAFVDRRMVSNVVRSPLRKCGCW